jgi:hypothetical protein
MFEQSVNFTPQAGTQMQGDRTGKHMEKNMRNISFKPWRASRERERESGFQKQWIERYYYDCDVTI